MEEKEALIQEIIESLARCQRLPSLTSWKEIGLSHAQAGMLYMLAYHGQTSAKQIAEYLGITKSAISQLIDPLVSKDLVHRSPDPKDRRIIQLSITSAGKKALKNIHKLKFSTTRSGLESLSPEELKQMLTLCKKIMSGTKGIA